MKNLKEKDLIVFDVETTGLSPQTGDRIVEIAALKVRNLKSIDKFYSLVDPQREIPLGASQVNGISKEMLGGAPTSRKILPDFFKFVDGCAIVGHNVEFDLNFLCYELSLVGMYLNDQTTVIDTLKMSRQLLPHLGRYPLWSVAQSLGIKQEQKHRAMSDVELTFDVLRGLCKVMGDRDVNEIGVLTNVLEKYQPPKQIRDQETFKW